MILLTGFGQSGFNVSLKVFTGIGMIVGLKINRMPKTYIDIDI